ncbi:MAG: MBL fold metallo-hydrolase, partial [Caldilineaceae bacterium]|nr:MBL fold metallo-hydrolase [Caldilineaceae bacterium]
MPRLIFLGTGAAVPSKDGERFDSATWFSFGKQCNLLIDCGEGTKYNFLRAKCSLNLHHIFLTHDHYDHIMGITGLLAMIGFLNHNAPPLTIYGPESALLRADVLVTMIRSKAGASPGMQVDFYPLTDNTSVDLASVRITAFATSHHDKPSIGYILQDMDSNRVIVTGDTMLLDSFHDVARDAELLIVNANFASERGETAQQRGHMSVAEAVH